MELKFFKNKFDGDRGCIIQNQKHLFTNSVHTQPYLNKHH